MEMPLAVRILFGVFAAMSLSFAALWPVAVIKGPREPGWAWGLPWFLARLVGGAWFASVAATAEARFGKAAAAVLAACLVGQIVAGRLARRNRI